MGKGWYVPTEDEELNLSAEDMFVFFQHMVSGWKDSNAEEFLAENVPGLDVPTAVDGAMRILVATECLDADEALKVLGEGGRPSQVEFPMTADKMVTIFIGALWIGFAHGLIRADAAKEK